MFYFDGWFSSSSQRRFTFIIAIKFPKMHPMIWRSENETNHRAGYKSNFDFDTGLSQSLGHRREIPIN